MPCNLELPYLKRVKKWKILLDSLSDLKFYFAYDYKIRSHCDVWSGYSAD